MSLSNNFPAVRPSLLLDFARSKTLDPRITFTRASTGTYYDSNGILQTAQDNQPRFQHDPTTEESLGLLIEEQRTYLFKYSSDYSVATWTKRSGTGVLAAQVVAPDGTLTGFSMYDSSPSTGLYIRQAATGCPDNTIVTVSIYVKKQLSDSVRLVSYAKDSTSNYVSTTLTFDTGVVTVTTAGTIANTAGGAVYLGNGWWRMFTTFNSSAGANDIPINFSPLGFTPVGDGTTSCYVWGAQLEAGTFNTSYIPTVASQVTRSADAASMTGTNFSSWFNNAEGTMYAEVGSAPVNNIVQQFWYISTTSQNAMFCRRTTLGRVSTAVNYSGSVQADISVGVVLPNTFFKTSFGYKVNDFASSKDGATVVADTSGSVPETNQINFGNSNIVGFQSLNGTISKIAYYPFRLPNNQLQSLTGS